MKAVALISGGLDSTLASKVILEQGIEVFGVTFITPFFNENNAIKVCRQLKIDLKIIDISLEHLKIVKSPKYGYGKNMNPCIDCHALMIKYAGKYMGEIGASFIITGEVLGERPKSQTKQALWIVEKESGFIDRILRPLSAKLLPETLPEREGWVDRNKLLAFHGRSRRPQMELAQRLGISNYLTPAGGCLLTDPGFSNRIKDLMKFSPNPEVSDIELLKIGRHFRISKQSKAIIGRNEEENKRLLALCQEGDYIFKTIDFPGPITIGRGMMTQEELSTVAAITSRYSKAHYLPKVKVSLRRILNGYEEILMITPIKDEDMAFLRI
ncbi:MAG: tRNA 4-thiouridine(8) synthase ThiI [bacterium]